MAGWAWNSNPDSTRKLNLFYMINPDVPLWNTDENYEAVMIYYAN